MRVIVVGLGVQGQKRRKFAGNDYIASVDPIHPDANYKSLKDVPLKDYDAALLCIPDDPKVELIHYLLENHKHVLVEKPLWSLQDDAIQQLQNLALAQGVVCYTAYNHRFEPHFVRMKDLIQSGVLGEIYHCRMFYGNGTARLVRESAWRDQGSGVLHDLGSHLLDTANFWFGFGTDNGASKTATPEFSIVSSRCFENRAPDHVVFASNGSRLQLEMEMTLLSWRNHFTCDIWAEKGSAHITSLCKWGPSSFIHRKRILPSGYPEEESFTLTESDPTWALEYAYFKELCKNGVKTNLMGDVWLNRTLRQLGKQATDHVTKQVTEQSEQTTKQMTKPATEKIDE